MSRTYLNCEICGDSHVYFHEQPDGYHTYDCRACGHIVFDNDSEQAVNPRGGGHEKTYNRVQGQGERVSIFRGIRGKTWSLRP